MKQGPTVRYHNQRTGAIIFRLFLQVLTRTRTFTAWKEMLVCCTVFQNNLNQLLTSHECFKLDDTSKCRKLSFLKSNGHIYLWRLRRFFAKKETGFLCFKRIRILIPRYIWGTPVSVIYLRPKRMFLFWYESIIGSNWRDFERNFQFVIDSVTGFRGGFFKYLEIVFCEIERPYLSVKIAAIVRCEIVGFSFFPEDPNFNYHSF